MCSEATFPKKKSKNMKITEGGGQFTSYCGEVYLRSYTFYCFPPCMNTHQLKSCPLYHRVPMNCESSEGRPYFYFKTIEEFSIFSTEPLL